MKVNMTRQTSPFIHLLFLFVVSLLMSGCGGFSSKPSLKGRTQAPKKATSRPYTIKGIRYYPQQHYEYDEIGMASWYGVKDKFHGKKTATGEIFNAYGLSAASKTLPIPCIAKVTNLENGRSVIVKVNDRGPFNKRIIDMSQKAAQLLGFYRKGIAKVRVQVDVQRSLALNKNPRQKVPVMLASTKQQSSSHRKKRKSLYLANASHQVFRPQKRPSWLAIRELSPQNQRIRPKKKRKHIMTAGGIFIQAGTFRNYQNAQNLTQKLQTLSPNIPVNMNPVSVKEEPMYTVRLGPLRSQEEAQFLLNQMGNKGHIDAKVVYE